MSADPKPRALAAGADPLQAERVRWLRDSAPYINAFRGRVFVVSFGGEVVADAQFRSLVHDLALLHSLGVRLVLVHGARPQVEARLAARGARLHYVNGLRVTDEPALECVKEAIGNLRVEIEALLSMGLANSPMAGARIRVASGNFVTARRAWRISVAFWNWWVRWRNRGSWCAARVSAWRWRSTISW